jgi:hypothetical protein
MEVHYWQNLETSDRTLTFAHLLTFLASSTSYPSQTQPKWLQWTKHMHNVSKYVGFGVDGHPSDLMSSTTGKILNFVGEFLAILSTLCS